MAGVSFVVTLLTQIMGGGGLVLTEFGQKNGGFTVAAILIFFI
jgi:hypothetical protein